MIFRKTNRRLCPGSRVGHMFPWEKNPMCSRVPQIHPLVDDCQGEAKKAAKRKVWGYPLEV